MATTHALWVGLQQRPEEKKKKRKAAVFSGGFSAVCVGAWDVR